MMSSTERMGRRSSRAQVTGSRWWGVEWAEGLVWVEDWPSAVVLRGRQPRKRHKCYAGAKSSGAVEGGCLGPERE